MKTTSAIALACLFGSVFLNNVNAQSPTDSTGAMHQRITDKVERVAQGAQKWAASGRDPSAILKTMQEKVGPLLDAGKTVEAETELDRVLEQLGQPTAKAGEKALCPTTGTSNTGSVWYTVGNLSVDLLARAWGSPIVDLERKSNRLQELMPKAQIELPGARRTRIAWRTAHATDEYPAI